ncbi:MAG TPA: hypothetical protein VE154_05830 [Chthoniobacterales bacterium]|nr:hypothetical protein [Chthoniobacterales bacterium]
MIKLRIAMLKADVKQVQTDDHPPRVNPVLISFALGPLLRGTLWETVAVPELRAQAKRVAETLLEQPPAPVGETEVMMEYMI